MTEWNFQNAVFTQAARGQAWIYWTDMRNYARLEPGVTRIELDRLAEASFFR